MCALGWRTGEAASQNKLSCQAMNYYWQINIGCSQISCACMQPCLSCLLQMRRLLHMLTGQVGDI